MVKLCCSQCLPWQQFYLNIVIHMLIRFIWSTALETMNKIVFLSVSLVRAAAKSIVYYKLKASNPPGLDAYSL